MTLHDKQIVARRSPGPQGEKVITLAALAVGGQGGGVLTTWIVEVAEACGYHAQSTSIAGVAQRTGATIYYVEMCRDMGRTPVFALAPSVGDVDILMASELMEGGRAILRGYVTPGRTTMIASTHRIPSVAEKIVPGDGRADGPTVIEAMGIAADRVVAFDMEDVAKRAGSVISSSLLGALAGSGALPFPREAYEEVIGRSGRGVDASLASFGEAYDIASGAKSAPIPEEAAQPEATDLHVPPRHEAAWNALGQRLQALPEEVRQMAGLGLRKVVDYQDPDYGSQYLGMLERTLSVDTAPFTLTVAAAKYCARALCYDDILRVADIKTRASRLSRVRDEVAASENQVLQVTEYFHPRFEELTSTMPLRLGNWLGRKKSVEQWYSRRFDKGRRIRTDSLHGFLLLWTLSSAKPFRRRLARHATEMAHVEAWFNAAIETAQTDPDLAAELFENYRLIKGYSDTHARGLTKFERVMSARDLLSGRKDAADWMRRVRTAALEDEKGEHLDGALATIRSFTG